MYKKRLIDDLLNFYKKSPFALLVEGAKGTGKTTTCKELTEAHFLLDDFVIREIVDSTPSIMFDSATDILIDEWQRMPEVWDIVRRKVDERTHPGSIFLTGSSPSLHSYVHSGSGRILRFKMRPLSFEEREIENPKIRLSKLLTGEVPEISVSETSITLEDYLDEIFKSGFPGIRKEGEDFSKRSIESYLDNIVHHDLLEQNIVVRRPEALRSWLTAYSAAIATNAAAKTIADAAFKKEEDGLSKETITTYRDVLKGIGIIEEVPAWLPLGQLFSNLAKSPKHFLVDPALAVTLLNVTKKNLLQGRRIPKTVGTLNKTFLGQLFEALVYQSLATYVEINEASLSHLRVRGGEKEVDFIVQKDDVLVAIEVKSKARIETKDVANLNWFEKRIGDEYDVIKVVITTGTYAYKRKDGVIITPLALFGC